MIDALKFVQGSVAKKDFVAALTHFKISGGRIQGYNGKLSLSSPIDLDLEVTPKGTTFAKAIQTCQDTVAMHLTKANRLAIKSGKFRAYIECTEEAFPSVEPEGDYVELENGILAALKDLAPFMADDASRPWARGILLRGGSAFATNNIIVAERWLGYEFPVSVNIPASTIKEIVRIKQEPIGLRITDTALTLHYQDDRWLRTQVSPLDWPDVSGLLNREVQANPLPDGFFEALEDLAPFVDEMDRVFFINGQIRTNLEEGNGASVELPGLPVEGCFQVKQLLALQGMVTTMDLSLYPAPLAFYGDKIRGVIAGMRM